MRYQQDLHVYHFLAPEEGHPTWEENSIEKNSRMQGPLILATTVNLINKSREMFQKVQQRYTRLINMIYFALFIDQSPITLQLKYSAEPLPTFWANHCFFTITGMWPRYVTIHCIHIHDLAKETDQFTWVFMFY